MQEKYRVSGCKIQNYMYLHIFTKYLKVLFREMDLVEIRLIRKGFIKDRSFRKIRPSPILWELFKSTSPSGKAVGYFSLFGNKFPRRAWNLSRCRDRRHCVFVGFFKGWTEVPHSLSRASRPPTPPPPSNCIGRRHCTVFIHMRVYIQYATEREERLWERQERCLKILNVNRTLLIVIFHL